jgi:mandelate racemase
MKRSSFLQKSSPLSQGKSTLLVARRQSEFGPRRAVGAQLVRHQHIRREALLLEQLAHELHGDSFVAPSLHEQVENLAFVVDRATARTAGPQSSRPSRRDASVPLAEGVDGVNAYNSNGLWLQSPESAAAEAVELLDERGGGFRALKLRLGRADPRDDLATIKAVRDAIGDNIDLMVDFNQALNLADAFRRCHMIDDHGFIWIEEPVLYEDFDSYARLTAEPKTPIQIGENFYGPRDVHLTLQKKACDLIMPDFMRIGGVTGFLRSAAIAGAAGIPISTHFYPEVGAHVMRVSESAHFLEWLDWSYPVLQRHYEVRDGQVQIPEAPGVGIEWDEKAVAASQVGLV